MAFKAGLEQWNLAVQTFESNDLHGSLNIFTDMGGTAKIHFSIGVIYTLLGHYDLAISSFTTAVDLDNYMAIGYFARALANVEINDIESAFEDFNDTLLYLRGNQHIDYFQLGLDFKLYSCEVLYNRGLCYFRLGSDAEGMNDLLAAAKEKQQPHHDIIGRAIENKGKNCPMFRLPDGCLFRPCESMVKNTKKIDYLGQAKVIAATTGPGSLGLTKPTRQFPEPLPLSFSAVNSALPSPTLLSRSGTLSKPLPKSPMRAHTLKSSASSGDLKLARANSVKPFSNLGLDDDTIPRMPQRTMTLANIYSSHAPKTPVSSSPDDDSPLSLSLSLSKPPSLSNSISSMTSPSPTLFDAEGLKPRAPVPKGKMKIKCHYLDTRTLMVDASIKFKDLQSKITSKFSAESLLKLKYKDEDEELVLITDQEDLDMALAMLCPNSDGTMSHLDSGSGFDGRFEVWCSL